MEQISLGKWGPAGTECLATVPLGLTHRIYPDGHAVAVIRGELDAATAEAAQQYVRQVVERSSGPVSLDLAGVSFCDARGLRALVGMAACARTAGRRLRLTGTRPGIIKIMRITGVDANFPELRGQRVPSP
jgi:anti-sigma B factor antagonist